MLHSHLAHLVLPVIFSLVSQGAFADGFEITNRTTDLDSSNPVFQALSSAADSLEDEINSILGTADTVLFLKGMANANAYATKGMGVDYASNPNKFVLGVGPSVALNLQSGGLSDIQNQIQIDTNSGLPPLGAAIQPTVLLGINGSVLGIGKLGPFEGKRLNLFLNGGYFGMEVGTDPTVDFSMFNLGAHLQYKLIANEKKETSLLFHWGGLDFSTGVTYASSSLGFSTSIDESNDVPVEGTSESVTLSWNGTYNVSVEAWSLGIPIEMSTNIRLLYLLTLFLGVGTDLNIGSAGITGTGSAPISASFTGAFSGTNLFSGDGVLDLSGRDSQSPSFTALRGFFGFQINLWAIKALAQLGAATNGTYLALAGIRIAI